MPKRGFLKTSPIIAIAPVGSLRRFRAPERFAFAPEHLIASRANRPRSQSAAPRTARTKVLSDKRKRGYHDYDEKAEVKGVAMYRVQKRRAVVSEARTAAANATLARLGVSADIAQPSPLSVALADCAMSRATFYRCDNRVSQDGTFCRRIGSGALPTVADEDCVELFAEVAKAGNYRRSLRSISKSLRVDHDVCVSPSTILRALKKEGWCYSKKRVVPRLSDEQKRRRLAFALQALREVAAFEKMRAKGEYVVTAHLDEKQFYLYTVRESTFSPKGERVYHQVQSKTQIPKVMFIATVATPVVDVKRGINFDGRVCFHPIVKISHYQCNTKNAASGDPYYETVNVDKAWFRKYIIFTVVPTLRAKCSFANRIVLQFDGAGGHGCNSQDAAEIFCATLEKVINKDHNQIPFTVQVQPPNSPDCNVLDLGLWNSMARALDHLSCDALVSEAGRASTMRLVMKCIRLWHSADAWNAYEKISKAFDYLFSCMLPHIKCHRGDNRNELPHRSDAMRAQMNEALAKGDGCDFYSPIVSLTPPERGVINDYKVMTNFLKSFVAGNEYLRMLHKESKERDAASIKAGVKRAVVSTTKNPHTGGKRAKVNAAHVEDGADAARKIQFDDEESRDDDLDSAADSSGCTENGSEGDDDGDECGSSVEDDGVDHCDETDSGSDINDVDCDDDSSGGVSDAENFDLLMDDVNDTSEGDDAAEAFGETRCKCDRKVAPIRAGREVMDSVQCSHCKFWSHTACYDLSIEAVQSGDYGYITDKLKTRSSRAISKLLRNLVIILIKPAKK